MAENFYRINNFEKAKNIYKDLGKKGEAFKWHSAKQIARILTQEDRIEKAVKLIRSTYKNLYYKDLYETFDFAKFLKNNEKFEESIIYYTEIINNIKKDHPLYPEVTDGRGVAYERIKEWDKAEKDLLASLEANPNQAYVINYLAYSWIEQGVKIEKSLNMLEKANKLRSNDPYIIDSIGWAYYLTNDYIKAENFLKRAVELMPEDPTVNDHYGDILWKLNRKIQARYFWKNVLNLEETEVKMKKKIKDKLIEGLTNS